MSESADAPLDEIDAAILDDVAAAYSLADPPPPDLDERVQFALALRDLDAEVAHLSEDVLVGSGARASEHPRTITFDAASLTLMVTVVVLPRDRRRVDGWLAPPAPLRVEMRTAGSRDDHPRGDGGRHRQVRRRRRPVRAGAADRAPARAGPDCGHAAGTCCDDRGRASRSPARARPPGGDRHAACARHGCCGPRCGCLTGHRRRAGHRDRRAARLGSCSASRTPRRSRATSSWAGSLLDEAEPLLPAAVRAPRVWSQRGLLCMRTGQDDVAIAQYDLALAGLHERTEPADVARALLNRGTLQLGPRAAPAGPIRPAPLRRDLGPARPVADPAHRDPQPGLPRLPRR